MSSGQPVEALTPEAGPGLVIGTPRLTASGILVIWAGIAMFVAGVLRYDGVLIWLGAMTLIVVGLARWWAPRNLRDLTVSRRRPGRVFAGEPFLSTITVTRCGDASDWLPVTGCGLEIRDGWLPRRNSGLVMGGGLASDSRATGEQRMRLFRRGRDERTDFEIRSFFPLGIFSIQARDQLLDETLAADGGILVYPQPLLPVALRRDLEMDWCDHQFSAGVEPETGDEFRGIRPYRSGDPVKAVHWPGTARAGELMVREWDPPAPRPQRYGLVLHTLEKGGRILRPDRWEMVLRVAAGLVTHCRDRGIALWFATETGIGQRWRMPDPNGYAVGLENLALAKRTTLNDARALSQTLESFGKVCDRVFVLSDVPLRQWRGLVEDAGMSCPVICLDAEAVVPIQKKISLRVGEVDGQPKEASTSVGP